MPASTPEQTAPGDASSGVEAPPPAGELTIGVDVGGTFTDLVAYDARTGSLRVVKLPSTPPDFHNAVIEAVRRVAPAGPAVRIVHGSTVATNALLQRAGQPVAFVTTEGFRDMLLIGRQNRPDLYALRVVRPAPLTPEENWFTVRERVGAGGEVVEALDPAEVDRLVQVIVARGLRHVAVCLLFSFVNPAHERMIGDRCRAAGLTVSVSSDVLPEFREYERASTTVINASLRPTVEDYLRQLEAGLRYQSPSPGPPGEGWGWGSDARRPSPQPPPPPSPGVPGEGARRAGTLRIMHSAGGTLSVSEAGASAAKLVLSGPAGGVMGALLVAEAAGFKDVITYDMGGTSTDVATIVDGRPQWTTTSTVDGLPIGLPAFDIVTVGAGGGSVAYLDAGGALRVGPRSAGAIPGPACYGRGGTEPTVTDANLLLGRILPDRFACGTMRVEPELARRAMEPLAAKIGKSLEDTALGIVTVAEQNMSRAVRAVTSRRGLDPRRFTLVSFGGAGGLHACALAESLEIPRVLVPPYCGVLSALGMVAAPPVADVSRTVVQLGGELDDARLAVEFESLAALAAAQIPAVMTASVERYADVRFRGQSYEVKVRVEPLRRSAVEAAFVAEYGALYGHVPHGRPIQIVTLRLRRTGHAPRLSLPRLKASPTVTGAAEAVSRADLIRRKRGGPVLLIDPEATTYVPPGWAAAGRDDGIVLLERNDRH